MPCSPFPYSPISAVLACAALRETLALTLSFISSLVFPLGRLVGPSSFSHPPSVGNCGRARVRPLGARRRRRRAADPLLGWSLTPMSLLKLKQLYNRLTRQVEETTETNRVTMEGWLHKRGEVKTSWQRRWWARPPTSTSGTTPQSSAAAPPPPPGTAPARPSRAATPVQRSQYATLARTDRCLRTRQVHAEFHAHQILQECGLLQSAGRNSNRERLGREIGPHSRADGDEWGEY